MKTPFLRRKLALEARDPVPDGGGGSGAAWIKLGDVYADVVAASGQEVYAESRQAQRVTHRVTLRCAHRASPARPRADQRLRAGDVVYDVKAVFDRDGSGRWLTCLCEEGSPA